ncbi:MAG: YihY/virulence factor BrkB family protein [Treponema sp.]|nr:YihY/virulence factor BrkB family protein [Treponema sp.]
MKSDNDNFNAKKLLTRFGQFLYLSISNFTKNSLWESASACAFGFIFSFIPVTLIIFTVLVGIIQVYPSIYNFIINFASEIETIVNIMPLLNRLMEMRSVKSFNIFLAVWVIWMARKLFNSIIISVNKVFRSQSKRKSWFNQLLTFISEFAATLIVALIIIVAFAFTRILNLPLFQTILSNFPLLFRQSSHNIGIFILYFVLFFCTVIAYRMIPGTKPRWKRCIFYAALCTIIFFVLSYFINLFMNVTNYNTIYGTISSLVLLMMKVYLFFVIFLFCAQMIFVSQFFDTLLRSEIYQLPTSESKGWGNYLRRFLFINPSQIQSEENTVSLKAGDILFRKGDKVDFVYYIKSGTIEECQDEQKEKAECSLFSKGSFLGDVQCILNEGYNATSRAVTDCELISFRAEEFMQIIEKSHHAARKAISKISEYTEGAYAGEDEGEI